MPRNLRGRGREPNRDPCYLHKGLLKMFRLTGSGILAVSIFAVFEFLGVGQPLPYPLTVSLYGFAICTPIAAIQAVMLAAEEEPDLIKNPLGKWGHILLTAGALLPFYVGTVFLFGYFSRGASIAFAVASSIPYALGYLMLVAGKQRYVYAAAFAVAVLVYNAFLLYAGFFPGKYNPFYEYLYQLP